MYDRQMIEKKVVLITKMPRGLTQNILTTIQNHDSKKAALTKKKR